MSQERYSASLEVDMSSQFSVRPSLEENKKKPPRRAEGLARAGQAQSCVAVVAVTVQLLYTETAGSRAEVLVVLAVPLAVLSVSLA